jgi:hypothetical protein
MSEAALLRVGRVVALGARITDRLDPLGIEARERLAGTSGLSPEGLELALTRHLEARASLAEQAALVAGAGRASRCHVVLAANVCTASLRALALAVATAPEIVVKPSRRDPVLAELLVRELARDAAFLEAGGAATLAADVAPEAGDELHVYGADATLEAFRARATTGVVFRGHGTGLGLALVGAGVDLEASARAIAEDVVAFDQRGCLSPRIVLVEGDAKRAAELAAALDHALLALGREIPRGALGTEDAGALALYRAALEALGAYRSGAEHGVGLDPAPVALVLPPALRVVHVAPADASTVGALLAPLVSSVAALGVDDDGALARAAVALAPLARRSRLGAMQRPPLDGPVDLRAKALG